MRVKWSAVHSTSAETLPEVLRVSSGPGADWDGPRHACVALDSFCIVAAA